MTTSTSQHLHRLRIFLLVLGVLSAAALGGWRVVALAQPNADTSTLRVGGVSYRVTHVEQVAGLSEEDLSGMSHGIQGLVPDDKALIRVTIVVRSGGASAIYDPAVLTVDDGSGGPPIAPAGGSLAPGGLSPHAQIEGSLAFVVPRSGQHLTLHARGSAGSFDLGSVDRAPAGAGSHEHGSASSAPASAPKN